MNGRVQTTRKKAVCIILVILILLICVAPVFYMTIYRWGDYYICPYIISQHIGIKPNFPAIKQYIYESLVPGLSRGEVEAELGKLGEIRVWRGYQVVNNSTSDEIWFNVCSHPLNAITIFAHYSLDGKLIWIEINNDD
jgi:hypothetical protein